MFVGVFVQQPAKKSHYQSKVFVCVSVISGRVPIIVRGRSVGFYLMAEAGVKIGSRC